MRKLWQRDPSRLTKITLEESADEALLHIESAWIALLRADESEALESGDYREAFLALMEAHRCLVLLGIAQAESAAEASE